MAKQDKSTEAKDIKRPTESRYLHPMDPIERWFEEVMPRGWMHPFRRHWDLPSLPDIHLPFEGKTPRVDVIERDEEFEIRAEMPGVKKDELDVTMTDQTVTIKAKTHKEDKEEKGDYYRQEISHGEFQRMVALPQQVDGDTAEASFKDGILTLTVPKVEASKRRTIEVH